MPWHQRRREGRGAASLSDDRAIARAWLLAADDGLVAGALEEVFAEAQREIAQRGPACWASGRCCNFVKAGHRLYVTGLEAAYTLARLGPEVRAALPTALSDALDNGGCPFQLANLCSVHEIKPLGCRVYFCDKSAQQWQQDLSERLLAEVRAIHDRFGVPYRYGEWRGLLGQALAACGPRV